MTKMLKFIKADWGNQHWGNNLEFLLFMICALILIPIIYNLVTYFLAKINRVQMGKTFGNNSQVVIGGIGNVIHEGETLLLGRLGGHPLHNVRYISWGNLRNFRNTVSIDHNWQSKNMYQSFFDYLLGFAPAYISALLLWGVQTLLGGNMYSYQKTASPGNLLHSFFTGLNTAFSGGNIFESLLFIVVVLVVGSTMFSTSLGALHRGESGVMLWLVAILLVWVILVFSTLMMSALPFFWGFMTLSAYLLGHVVVYLVVIFILICIFTALNKL